MDALGAVARLTAQAYPALLVITLASVAANLWAYRRRRWWLMSATLLLVAAATLLYTGGEPAEALARLDATLATRASSAIAPGAAAAGRVRQPAARRSLPAEPGARLPAPRTERSLPSYASRWQSRPPDDFPVPSVFQFEYSNSQQSRNRTIRYRFRGEPADAVRDLREMGSAGGWQVEIKAPHRLVFRKGRRVVEAWFSYAARSVVLDVSDARG
jgi:hypothetical protein